MTLPRKHSRCKDSSAPLKIVDGRIQLEMLVDRLSIEIFGNHGRVYMPMGSVLDVDNKTVQVTAGVGRQRSAR